MKSNVHVVGMGLITAIGNSVSESLTSLQSDRSGIGSLTLFDTVHHNLPVGEVKLSNQLLAERLDLPATLTRTALLGIHAASEALLNSRIGNLDKRKTGLISATTVGGMDKS